MSQSVWNHWLLGSAVLGFSSMVLIPTTAAQELDSMAQVTPVSQLRDVQPNDWASEALRSLSKRYGCIVGYPDRTYQGNKVLTRWEFAAGLNACLNVMERLIQQKVAVSQEDLNKLERLTREFEDELTALGGRVDNLEGQAALLEDHQFSTTTKLEGEAIFALTGLGTGSQDIRNSNTTPGVSQSGDLNPNSTINPTFVARTRLNFLTSFTGEDLLYLQMQTGNGGQTPAILGQDLGLGGNIRFNTFDLDYAGAGPGVALNYLYYKGKINQDLQFSLGPLIAVNDYIDGNTFTNDEAVNFSSTFFKNNPLLFPVSGGGAGALIRVGF